MPLFIKLVAMVVVFALLFIGIGYVPETPKFPYLKPILYGILCVAAAVVVWQQFIA
jgi:hypothetical protein